MDDYIKREPLLKSKQWLALSTLDNARAKAIIQDQPAADVVEVQHGEWVGDAFCDVLTCKECSYEHALYVLGKLSATNYCPNCGAKMDGDTE